MSGVESIDKLAEQTRFLLEKQEEILKTFENGFDLIEDVLEKENEKTANSSSDSDLISFENVFTMISKEREEAIEPLEEDIKFLKEQAGAIEEVQKTNDQKRADELAKLMIEDADALMDTEEFKKEVIKEYEAVRNNFNIMVEDIKGILQEEGIKSLEVALKAYTEEREKLSECDEECDEDCVEECEKECGEENNECPSSCSSCSGCNIFAGINDDDKEK